MFISCPGCPVTPSSLVKLIAKAVGEFVSFLFMHACKRQIKNNHYTKMVLNPIQPGLFGTKWYTITWYKLTKFFVTFKTIPIWKKRLNAEYDQTQKKKIFWSNLGKVQKNGVHIISIYWDMGKNWRGDENIPPGWIGLIVSNRIAKLEFTLVIPAGKIAKK